MTPVRVRDFPDGAGPLFDPKHPERWNRPLHPDLVELAEEVGLNIQQALFRPSASIASGSAE